MFICMLMRREDGHVLSMGFDVEAEGEGKKGRPKMTWKNRLMKKV